MKKLLVVLTLCVTVLGCSKDALTPNIEPPVVAPLQVSITASAGAGGTISPIGTTKRNLGGKITYYVIPDKDHSILSVKLDGVDVPFDKVVSKADTLIFDYILANQTLKIEFIDNNTFYLTSGRWYLNKLEAQNYKDGPFFPQNIVPWIYGNYSIFKIDGNKYDCNDDNHTVTGPYPWFYIDGGINMAGNKNTIVTLDEDKFVILVQLSTYTLALGRYTYSHTRYVP